jgi:DNA-directed RNA polymerase specialized sigma24 family protein
VRDAETVARLSARDPEGLYRLLLDYGGQVAALLKREFAHVLDPGEVDEALITAAARAWLYSYTYKPRDAVTLRAWFYVIAHREATKILKRARGARQGTAVAEGSAERRVSSQPISRSRQLAADLRECLADLPSLQRSVLEADLAAGGLADSGQLARELDTTLNSVYASRSAGKRALRRALAERSYHFTEPSESPC